MVGDPPDAATVFCAGGSAKRSLTRTTAAAGWIAVRESWHDVRERVAWVSGRGR